MLRPKMNITCSPIEPLQWMGAVRKRVQIYYKNTTIIHKTPIYKFSCETYLFIITSALLHINFKALLLNLFFASQDVNWGTGVVWITFGLLWFWRHPFTAEDPLVMLNFSKSVLMKKLIYILDGLRVSNFSADFHFWVNYSFNHSSYMIVILLCFSVSYNVWFRLAVIWLTNTHIP